MIPNHDDVTCRLLEALRDGRGRHRVGQYVKFQRKLDERFLRGRSSRHGVIASPVQRAAAGRAAGCTSRFAVFVQCRNNDYCALVMACVYDHGRDMMMVVIARRRALWWRLKHWCNESMRSKRRTYSRQSAIHVCVCLTTPATFML